MKKINLVFILAIVFALFVCASGVVSATIYVPDDYTKIQWAVDNASARDTIINYKHVTASDKEITNFDFIKTIETSSSGDWIVNTTETRSDEMIILNGNLTIQSGGSLTLDNFTLLMNCTFGGQYHIEVQDGGELHILNGSNITAVNQDYRYCFWIRNGSTFVMTESELHYCGYGIPGEVWDGLTGMWIGGDNAIIDGNLISQNGVGIYLSAKFCNISNNTITNNTYYGIAQWSAHNNTITNNKITFNGNCGIGGNVVSNSTIEHNNISNNNGPGIYLGREIDRSASNTISNNSINSNYVGIWLNESWNNTLSNNNCSNNYIGGVFLYSSNNNTLISNTFVNNGLLVGYSYDNVVEDNTVNGKPLRYFEDLSDATITDDAGQVILVNCNNITVEGQNLSYASVGVELWETNDSTILNNIASNNHRMGILVLGSNNIVKDNNASNNFFGIAVFSGWLANDIVSVNNIVENNTANNNTLEDYQGEGPSPCGIRLDASHNIVKGNRVSGNFIGIGVGSGPDGDILTNNTVSCNHASNNIYGVFLINSSYSVVENNTVSDNSRYGIYQSSSSNNTITNNAVKFNNDCGINVWNSSNNTLTANTANSNNGSGISICESERNIINNNLALNNSWGISLQYCNNTIIVSNNASFNRGDVKGDGINFGFCNNNNTVSNNNASGNIDAGIQVMNSSNNNTIANNTANLNNYCGIHMWSSSNNTVTANIANSNDYYGIGLTSSSNNLIYNNYFNNTNNAYDNGNNIWNITKTAGTNILGGLYLGGNYWSDYLGKDLNGDGIGDTLLPYNSSGNIRNGGDWRPLVRPAPIIFDTGEGTYPSIMGTHEGTIKPNHTVIATKLYTYPCAGTGGHTEYARIWNLTWNATATWEGYIGDWHNITFDKTVVLMANETYNYTIRTGSYPQIIHETSFNATRGTITCEEFTDANGKRYNGWIPAIRLGG